MPTNLNLYDTYRKAAADPLRAAAIPGTLKCMLVTATYAPNQVTDEFVTTPIVNEVVGSNYTARGNACATPTWTGPDGAGLLTFDASDPATWLQHATGFTLGRRAIVYYDTAVNGTSRLVGFTDNVGSDLSNVGADVTVVFNVAGIYTAPR